MHGPCKAGGPKNNSNHKPILNINIRYNIVNLSYIALNLNKLLKSNLERGDFPIYFYVIFIKITDYTPKNTLNYKSSLNIKIRYNIINLSYIAYSLD